jgi:hypothetical protein
MPDQRKKNNWSKKQLAQSSLYRTHQRAEITPSSYSEDNSAEVQ